MDRKIYMAPMEGVTTYVYRQIFNEFFGGVDKFFTPFIAPNMHKSYSNKELKEFLPENNEGMNLVPQIITKDANLFVKAACDIAEFGYKEINLNCGCPSGTVVAKGRGAGMLMDTLCLDEFLERIFDGCDGKVNISIKTRIGVLEADEWNEILDIYNKYPICELIIHPRTRKDYYKNEVNISAFDKACREAKMPICYNGDVFCVGDYIKINDRYEDSDRNFNVMLGRGLVSNPILADMIKSGKTCDKEYIQKFHDRLLEVYDNLLSGDKNKLFKMKEFLTYMICLFDNSEKHWKKIRKAKSIVEYKDEVRRLFAECDINLDNRFKVN